MGRDYRNIKAWQYADELVKIIYSVTKRFPKEEMFGLTSQIRRASVSVATNIVEGSSRGTLKDYLHFLYISRGSVREVDYLMNLACNLKFVLQSELDLHLFYNRCQETASTLQGLIRSVELEVFQNKSHASSLKSRVQ